MTSRSGPGEPSPGCFRSGPTQHSSGWSSLPTASAPRRPAGARQRLLAPAQVSTCGSCDGRDGYLPYADAVPTKEAVAAAAAARPDLVLVHRSDDAHQDHRFAAELAWQLCRWSTILEYEVPKWDGDVGPVNLYVPLDLETSERKIEHLLGAFPSQAARDWFTADAFRAILRLRGIESRSPSGLAEAFVARKLVV